MQEHYIICAAVRTTDGIVHIGKRHSDCFALIGAIGGIKYHIGSDQGFVDNRWEYKRRSEAFRIAEKAGQLKNKRSLGSILFSEDLY